ncbi:MAG: AraC family transcriptional regulator [Lachnospiraceae bacterium]
MDEFCDITVEDLNPSIFWCSRAREAKNGIEHAHASILEFSFILSGEGKYIVDGKSYDVKQGDMVFCNPGVSHQSIVTDPDNPLLEFICGFSDIHFTGMAKDYIELPDGNACLTFSSDIRREISRCCYEIVEENYANQPGRYYIIKAQIVKILVLLFRTLRGEETRECVSTTFNSYSKNYVVDKIKKYINTNYDKKIYLDQIADNMYLSPVYISKMFKEKTGIAPINYLIKVRLEKAKEILESGGNETVKEIAASVGYDNPYHFSKMFKKHYGVSPLTYRRENQ